MHTGLNVLSEHMFQLENHRKFYEIWYKYYVISGHIKFIPFNFLLGDNMADALTCKMGQTLVQLGPEIKFLIYFLLTIIAKSLFTVFYVNPKRESDKLRSCEWDNQ